MSRFVLHIDANGYYAAVMCLLNPAIRHLPVVVCGDPQQRHGIVLAKNQVCKDKGYEIKTAEPVGQVLRRYPNVELVAPLFDQIEKFTDRMRAIFLEYSDRFEPYGMDEGWLEITSKDMTWERAEAIAHEIRLRMKFVLGITVSIGVSFNKIFAKLGSDIKKPDAVTVITERNFHDVVWPLPASDLLFVGPATTKKLALLNVKTIGDLANADSGLLRAKLHSAGLMHKNNALGLDQSPVTTYDFERDPKSIGNSKTTPVDIESLQDAKSVIYALVEHIGYRMRAQGLQTRCVEISVRTTDLQVFSAQRALRKPTDVTDEIAKTAIQLYKERYLFSGPYRSMGVHTGMMSLASAPVQIAMFPDESEYARRSKLDRAIDRLTDRNGPCVRHAVTLSAVSRNMRPDKHLQPSFPFYRG